MNKLLLFVFFFLTPLFSEAKVVLSAKKDFRIHGGAAFSKAEVVLSANKEDSFDTEHNPTWKFATAAKREGAFDRSRAKIGPKQKFSQFLVASKSSAPLQLSAPDRSLKAKFSRFLIAQDEDSFVEEDFKDIEGEEDDKSLEEDFDSLAGEEAPDNFDEDDFEIEDDEEEEEEEEDEEEDEEDEEEEEMNEDDFDEMDYEHISEDPDYEISDEEDDGGTDDKDLEQGFETEEDAEKDMEEIEEEEDLDLEEEFVDEEGEASLPEDSPIEEEELIEEDELLESDLADEEDPAFEEDSTPDGTLNLVSNIRYLAERDQIIIDCSEPVSYQTKKNEENNQLILEILETKLGPNLHWPYVLRDFDTDFGLIKADQKDDSTTRIVIQMKEGARSFPETALSEDGNQILVGFGDLSEGQMAASEEGARLSDSILPEKTLEDLYFGKLEFSGTPISFHVIDAPIKQVLRFISEESGLNMVIGETVQGTVTLKLEDVPWDQALYTIFKVKSLGYTRDGNVITVLPLSDIEQRAKKLREISEREVSLAPYQTKVIPVNYGSLDDIEGKIKTFSTKQTDLTVGGQVIKNKESGALIIIDTPKVIKKISELVKYLDQPPRQVMVEAKIVDASENFSNSFGLTWDLGGNFPITIRGDGIADVFNNFAKDIAGNWTGNVSGNGAVASLRVNGLPFVDNITASLNIAEQEGYAQVLSSPKVVVISGKTATITRSSPILVPAATTTYPNAAGGGEGGGAPPPTTETFTKEDVSTDISVTPTVTAGGSVFLKVDVKRSDPGGKGGAFKTTRSASTEVLVKNGQTVVIGGIYDQDESNTGSGFPFVRRIPFLSWLFGTKETNRFKAELLVFITPKVLDSHE